MNHFFELTNLLTKDIPTTPINQDGFLEIIRMSNREVVNSRVYAYFLNPNNQSLIAKSFVQALLQIIETKTGKKLVLNNYNCFLEVTTYKGRIDLVIEDKTSKSVVIIENKLFHHLNNDLVDYWNFYSQYESSNKVGVLLTLEKNHIPEEVERDFINIRHLEWITAIQQIGLPSSIPIKLYIYLNDFFQTIKYLSKNNKMNEQATFFFLHSKKILQVRDTIYEAEKFIENQLSILAEKLNLDLYGSSMEWRNFWNEREQIRTYYTLVFEEVMKGGNTVQIIIELEREDMKRAEELHKLLENDEAYQKMNKDCEETKHYIHLARIDYTLTFEEIKSFANVIHQKIKEDFEPTMNKIIDYLYKK